MRFVTRSPGTLLVPFLLVSALSACKPAPKKTTPVEPATIPVVVEIPQDPCPVLPPPEMSPAVRAYLADQKACPSVGIGTNPRCPEPPVWQVDALAADMEVFRRYAWATYRLCTVSRIRIESSSTPLTPVQK